MSEWNWETHPDSVAMHTEMVDLREQLAAVTAERDELAEVMNYRCGRYAEELAAVTRERDELVALLDEAVQDISDWGAYADEYFQEKWELKECIQRYKDALAKCKEES